MVSLKSEYIKNFINVNSKNSLFLKSFCAFLFKKSIAFTQDEIDELKTCRKDYKHVAAQGYMLENNDIQSEFIKGLEWLIGRNFDKHDNFYVDNITILGLFCGIKQIQNQENLEKSLLWINEILKIKKSIEGQNIYGILFEELFNSKTNNLEDSQLDIDLWVFSSLFQNKKCDPKKIDSYYGELIVNSTPYQNDDFFRSIINVFNEVSISKQYLFNNSDFENKIEEKVNETKQNIFNYLNNTFKNIANSFADLCLLIYMIILMICLTIIIIIIQGDWNWYEPKTYILGLPLLTYIINVAIFYILNKEISLNPKLVRDRFYYWKLRSLQKKFKISENQNLP